MSTTMDKSVAEASLSTGRRSVEQAEVLERSSAAFGLAAAIAILFNTLLAWIKDAYDPLNSAMASLTGHHWITHGLADVVLFVVLGAVFMITGAAERMSPHRLVSLLVGAVVIAGLGLAGWFFFV